MRLTENWPASLFHWSSESFWYTGSKNFAWKNEKLRLRGNINHLISSSLTDRWQYVSANMFNTKQKICTGVPQGSVLGLFFLLYINDLPNVCKLSKMIFAEDATIINAGKRTNPLNKNDIVPVSKWFKSSKLTINTDNCEAMSFGCGKRDKLSIFSTEIGDENICKYLGVHIEKQLEVQRTYWSCG